MPWRHSNESCLSSPRGNTTTPLSPATVHPAKHLKRPSQPRAADAWTVPAATHHNLLLHTQECHFGQHRAAATLYCEERRPGRESSMPDQTVPQQDVQWTVVHLWSRGLKMKRDNGTGKPAFSISHNTSGQKKVTSSVSRPTCCSKPNTRN